MRVPELCLYFPIILLVFVFGFAYFARPRVSLLGRPRFRFCVFVCFFGFDFFTWLSSPGIPEKKFVFFCVFLLHVLKTCLYLYQTNI